MVVDAKRNLYVSDTYLHSVYKVDAAGTITPVAGTGLQGAGGDGGPATNADFTYVNGVVVDGAGNLYVSDAFNHRIRHKKGRF